MKYRPNFSVRSSVKTISFYCVLVTCALVPGKIAAEVVVSEIMYDALGSDTKAEWIELQNTGSEIVNISKWKFSDGANHVLNAPPKNGSIGSLEIKPGGFLILASDAATFLSLFPHISVSVIDTVMSLPNGGGSISLISSSSTIEATFSYSSSQGAGGTGESLQLINHSLVPGIPTPGTENSNIRALKPEVAAPKSKSLAKTHVEKLDPHILDGTSTVRDLPETEPDAPSSRLVASAVVPLGESSNSLLPWIFGVLAIAVAGTGALLVSKQRKNGEWVIEEIE